MVKDGIWDTGTIVKGVACGAAISALLVPRVRDWIEASGRTWMMQLGYMAQQPLNLSWPFVQYEIWTVMSLEKVHMLESLAARRQGTDLKALKHLDPNLPHVDNQSSRATKGSGAAMMDDGPVLKDLVLIGGGHTHAYVLKNFGMKPLKGVQVTLITRDVMTPYSGMLPGHVAGIYTHEECHIDLMLLGRFARARVIHAEAVGLDRANNMVHLSDGRPPVHFDVLSIDIGSAPQTLPSGVAAKAQLSLCAVKPIDSFSSRWNVILERVLRTTTVMRLGVVGGGAGGVEIALSMQARLHKELKALGKDPRLVEMFLLSAAPVVMPAHCPATQRAFKTILEERGIDTGFGCRVQGAEKGEEGRSLLVCEDGRKFACDECIWCTSAAAQSWLRETGLELDAQGFIAVHATLQSRNTSSVFAAGDIAAMLDNPRPKAGVFAVRAGPPLANNLRRVLLGDDDLEEYIPQKSFLGIIGTGDPNQSVASRGEMAMVGGPWLWDLKDWIDRKWMAGYSHALPIIMENMMASMGGPDEASLAVASSAGDSALSALAHASMRCGGCGSKVGATVLSKVMEKVKPQLHHNPEVLLGLDAPDDCAVVKSPGPGKAMVHTVDFFRSFIGDPYVFGQVAANHSLSDCHAMCAEAQTALAIVVVPYAAEPQVQATLEQLMAGACKTLKEAGCALVGGHTCEGKELAIGFCINGVADTDQILSKGGMHAGEVVILTKAVGTGALFAAEMRGRAKGSWVAHAMQAMLVSNQDPALCLRKFGATSCTDVTGFGMLGHLIEMVKASNDGVAAPIAVRLDMSSVPLLPGSLEVVQAGIFSSLQPANLRLKRGVINEAEALTHPSYPLLYDPQTAGGLLASVPAHQAEECLAALKALGCTDACVVGSVVTAPKDLDAGQCVWCL